MTLGNKCHVCGCEGMNYIDFDRRLKIAAIKLRLAGVKQVEPNFADMLNQETKAAGTPLLIAFEMKDGVTGIACGSCISKFNLTIQRMEMPEETPDERDVLFDEARAELAEEIAEYLQRHQ